MAPHPINIFKSRCFIVYRLYYYYMTRWKNKASNQCNGSHNTFDNSEITTMNLKNPYRQTLHCSIFKTSIQMIKMKTKMQEYTAQVLQYDICFGSGGAYMVSCHAVDLLELQKVTYFFRNPFSVRTCYM